MPQALAVYSGDPSKSDKDWVRWRVGDTDTTDWLQTDGEILQALSDQSNKWLAAAAVCEAIAAKFARKVDGAMGKFRLNRSQKVKHYRELAAELRAEGAVKGAPLVYAAAHSMDEKENVIEDDDRVVPAFAVRMHEPEGLPGQVPSTDLIDT